MQFISSEGALPRIYKLRKRVGCSGPADGRHGTDHCFNLLRSSG